MLLARKSRDFITLVTRPDLTWLFILNFRKCVATLRSVVVHFALFCSERGFLLLGVCRIAVHFAFLCFAIDILRLEDACVALSLCWYLLFCQPRYLSSTILPLTGYVHPYPSLVIRISLKMFFWAHLRRQFVIMSSRPL